MGAVIHVHSVYLNKLYQQVVADVAEESMKAAVERVPQRKPLTMPAAISACEAAL